MRFDESNLASRDLTRGDDDDPLVLNLSRSRRRERHQIRRECNGGTSSSDYNSWLSAHLRDVLSSAAEFRLSLYEKCSSYNAPLFVRSGQRDNDLLFTQRQNKQSKKGPVTTRRYSSTQTLLLFPYDDPGTTAERQQRGADSRVGLDARVHGLHDFRVRRDLLRAIQHCPIIQGLNLFIWVKKGTIAHVRNDKKAAIPEEPDAVFIIIQIVCLFDVILKSLTAKNLEVMAVA